MSMTESKANEPTPDMGSARQPLAQPEQVGSISVAEAAEIRERRRLREKQELDVKDFETRLLAEQTELDDKRKVLTLLRVEHEQFLQRLLRDRGLPMDDDYNINSESGLIFRTARSVPTMPPEIVEQTKPVEPALTEANGAG